MKAVRNKPPVRRWYVCHGMFFRLWDAWRIYVVGAGLGNEHLFVPQFVYSWSFQPFFPRLKQQSFAFSKEDAGLQKEALR